MFRVADDRAHSPVDIYSRLVASEPEFQVLKDGSPDVAFMFRQEPQFKGGRIILGTVHMPMVNGTLSKLFDWLLEDKLGLSPTYLFMLDLEFWRGADPRRREILMFHEMKHCDQAVDQYGAPKFTRDGQPVWRLVGHDIEEFNEVVRRYGAYSDDLRNFRGAMQEGDAR